jgi:hypothetical protein
MMPKPSPLLEDLRQQLGPTPALTLEERLERLTQAQRTQFDMLLKAVRTAMQFQTHSGKPARETYEELARGMYPRANPELLDLVAAVLGELEPVELAPRPVEPQPAAPQEVPTFTSSSRIVPDPVVLAQFDQAAQRRKLDLLGAKPEAQPVAAPEQLSFLDNLEASESSGRSDAEITVADGRRFVGKLQFGEARLKDYQNATGTNFTQEDFRTDEALQDRVAAWHIADLDKSIDALGEAALGYDRDGLKAVAHLGGVTGMQRFVQSGGKYNPSDELGTSLKDYYDKFAASEARSS